MLYAVELFLDEDADRRVRQIWAALDERGVTSLGSTPSTRYHPHVTLSVYERGDAAEVAGALRPVLATTAGLPLPLASLGFFLTEEAPAFLGVVPTSGFLGLHRAVHHAIEPLVEGIWPYYTPDGLVPHCTLAVGVADTSAVAQTVARFPLPVRATVRSAQLVELPGGQRSTPLIMG
ncbi:MAG: 2'-5' RNA ligase family protein [Dactylosporangium sp.]|nr:2'-5' RNA ligase family protein [Dactylosporangium sp.]NNJ62156.1 2'-5' RNA ligase family protein [Dactylosporangium sp.]